MGQHIVGVTSFLKIHGLYGQKQSYSGFMELYCTVDSDFSADGLTESLFFPSGPYWVPIPMPTGP